MIMGQKYQNVNMIRLSNYGSEEIHNKCQQIATIKKHESSFEAKQNVLNNQIKFCVHLAFNEEKNLQPHVTTASCVTHQSPVAAVL